MLASSSNAISTVQQKIWPVLVIGNYVVNYPIGNAECKSIFVVSAQSNLDDTNSVQAIAVVLKLFK